MKKSSLLILAACAFAPLHVHAQSAQEIITHMLAPAVAPAPSTAAQRAAISPTLAHIPAGYDFISIYNIPAFLQKMEAKGYLDASISMNCPIVGQSMAGRMRDYEAAACVLSIMSDYTTLSGLFTAWAEQANEAYAPFLAEISKDFSDPNVLTPSLAMELAESKFCCYNSIEFTQQIAPMVGMYFAQADQLFAELPEGITLSIEGNKITISISGEFIATTLSEGTNDPAVKEALAGLKGESFFIVAKLQDAILNTAFASSLDLIQWPENAESSILASPDLSFMDKQPKENSHMAVYASAESLNSLNNLSRKSVLFEGVANIFHSMGELKAENKAAFDAAAAAIAELGAAYVNMLPTYKAPLTALAWMDDDINLESSCTVLLNFKAGSLKMSALADDPNTLLYAETTEITLAPIITEQLSTMTAEASTVAQAVALTLKPEAAQQVHSGSLIVNALLTKGTNLPPELAPIYQIAKQSLDNTRTLTSSVDDSLGIVVSQSDTPEAVPAVAVFAGIKDKASFSSSCQQLFKMVSGFAQGSIPENAFTINEQNDATTLTVAHDGLDLNAQLSSTQLSVSNNAALQASITQQNAAIPAAGAVFVLNMKPLSSLVISCADGDVSTTETFDAIQSAIKAVYTTVQTQEDIMTLRFKIDLN